MAQHTPSMPLSRIAAATALTLAASAGAQVKPALAPSQAEIVITSPGPQQLGGFGDIPLSRSPFSGLNIDAQTLRDIGASRISDALRLDASVADAYNSPAYWDQLSVRGYTLDNRYNYRREGLPISAETMIALDNKERIELFKGTSGIQAGTSAPGGLANYVVKRPPGRADETIRSLGVAYGPGQNRYVALDLGARFGSQQSLGYRLNAAYEDLDPYIRQTQGRRQLLALAMDWRAGPDSRLDWEIEQSERSQIGVNAWSLLGDRLPAPVDGKRNLTWQPWVHPGVFAGTTGSLRWQQNLSSGWLWSTRLGSQRLRTDDRLVFAYGCSSEERWDRFCSDGSFDLYDYRSENERRRADALQTELSGQLQWGGLRHDLRLTLMRSRQQDLPSPTQAYNWIGIGSVNTPVVTTPDATALDPNTLRHEYSTEWSLQDRIGLDAQHQLWLGLRHTRLDRASERSDGSRAVRDERSFNTPWVALTRELRPGTVAYVSHGQGVETDVAPNRSRYTNRGQALPALRSRQTEVGLKHTQPSWQWQAALFDIRRPVSGDQGSCDGDNSCTRVRDGDVRNLGLELSSSLQQGPWQMSAGLSWLHSRRENAQIDPAVNGQRSINVPRLTLRASADYRWTALPGLRTGLRISHEGRRPVLADGSLQLPAWTTLDLSAHYRTRLQGIQTDWSLGIDNLADRHFWREAPLQFGHHYLYPGAPRTLRLGMQFSF